MALLNRLDGRYTAERQADSKYEAWVGEMHMGFYSGDSLQEFEACVVSELLYQLATGAIEVDSTNIDAAKERFSELIQQQYGYRWWPVVSIDEVTKDGSSRNLAYAD